MSLVQGTCELPTSESGLGLTAYELPTSISSIGLDAVACRGAWMFLHAREGRDRIKHRCDCQRGYCSLKGLLIHEAGALVIYIKELKQLEVHVLWEVTLVIICANQEILYQII